MHQLQETSRIAYEEIKPDLPRREAQVFQALQSFGKATNAEIARYLNMPQHAMTGRTNSLVKKGAVRDSGDRKRDADTGKKCILWEVVPSEPEQISFL